MTDKHIIIDKLKNDIACKENIINHLADTDIELQKQLKRKEQENEELKKNYFTVIQQRNVAEQQLDQLKAENDKLKEEVQYLKSEIERISEQ